MNTLMTLQVVEAQVFDESNQKKNIKARVSLSDGLSKIIVMVPDKVYLQIVSQSFNLNNLSKVQNGDTIEQHAIWSIQVGKQ